MRILIKIILCLLPISVSYAASFAANTSGGSLISNLTMNLKSSCSASVDDANFGNQTVAELTAGTIAAKNITIKVSCDAILASYTVKLTPTNGVHSASIGTISTNNPNVAYQLRWADGTVAISNSYVTFGSALTPVNKPTAVSFNVPISVKPVVKTSPVKAGAANTSLTIALAFN